MKNTLLQIVLVVAAILALSAMKIAKPQVNQEPKLSLTDTLLTKIVKTEAEWKKILTPAQFYILRQKGTDPAFNNAYHDNHEKGNYFCSACHLPLFSSKTKFESGLEWPPAPEVCRSPCGAASRRSQRNCR